jgi:PAS domain S-box-containing protein
VKKLGKHTLTLIILISVIAIIATYLSVSVTKNKLKNQLLQDARIASESINPGRLKELTGTENDIGKPDYERLKVQLESIRKSHEQCKFLYLLGRKKDGTVFFFLDSQSPESDDYAPPGLVYQEVSDEYLEVFEKEKSLTVGPIHDRWGKLYTSLIPIKDPDNAELMAVLGMDMTANNWNKLIFYDLAKVLGIVILIVVLVYYVQQVRYLKSQKEAERRIKESEEKFRNIYNSANDAIFIHEFESGKIIDVNETMLKMYGYSSKDEVLGRRVDYFSPDSGIYTIEYAREWRDKAVKSAKSQIFEWRAKRKDGNLFWVEVNLDIVKILNVKRVLIIARDITYRKKTEHDLKMVADRYQSLFEQAADGILTGNSKGIITKANKSICEISGYERSELEGNNISMLFTEETLKEKPFRYDLVESGETVLNEREMVRKDGSRITIEMNTKKVGEDILQAYIRDITERKKAQDLLSEKNKQLSEAQSKLTESNQKLRKINEELTLQKQELLKAKARAEESDRLKTAFLANMSHEIRTPMNGIVGFAQILLEQDYTQQELKKFLQTIYSQSHHLMKIIDDVIDIAKIEANELSINKEFFDLNDLFDELYENTRVAMASKNNKVQLVVSDELDDKKSKIYSDPVRLKQVFTNLLDNAYKFTEEGMIEMGYNHYDDKKLLFYVKDSGTGIPQEKTEEIFQRFRQGDESLTSQYEGTGLGLSISRGIINLLGGEIWAEANKDKGSVFYFTIPYNKDWIDQTDKISTKKSLRPKWDKKTILLVEDDYASRLFMDKLLAPTQVKMITSETGQQALDIFKQEHKIDLILMDIRLPDINGLEVTKQIRKLNKKIPIIAQTAHAMGNDRKKCFDAGANEYISKPIDIDKLLFLIDRYF